MSTLDRQAPIAPLHDGAARFDGGLHEVANGVYAWLQPNGGLGESNAGLVVGEHEALLIDSLWDLKLTRRMLDAIEDRIEQPITTLVNTHADGDHTWGNQLVGAERIIATRAAAETFDEERPELLRFARAAGTTVKLARNLRLPGVPREPSFEERAFAPFDFAGITLLRPTTTFSKELTLHIGGRDVELLEVGPAHSAGDLIAWIPDASTVFSADILMRGGIWPVMWAGPITNWINGLDTILELDPNIIVPGHGPISTIDDVKEMRTLMSWINDHATAQLQAGLTVRQSTLALLELAKQQPGPWTDLGMVNALHITIATIKRHLEEAGPAGRVDRLRTLIDAGGTARQATAA